MSTGRFKSLMERFPDAKIIYIARHLYDSVPWFRQHVYLYAPAAFAKHARYAPPQKRHGRNWV